jgi:aspartate/methionine/tyrosine aminotransferase
MKLARRALDAEPFHAMAIGERAAELEAAGTHVVKLSLGEPDFGAPPAVRAAMRDVMDGRALPYTAALGLPALRRAIAGFYRDKHGVTVDPARIVITSGASAALLLVTAATTEPGDEVVIADPSYPCNRELVRSFGGTLVSVPTTAASRYQLDVASVEAAWTARTSAIMIASPSNPTGTSIPHDGLTAICDLARERDAWRIVDEIYLDLADPDASGAPVRTVLAHDPDAVVIGSFSKYFGMTGWRLGWAVLPASLLPVVERLATNYFLCASAPAQQAALAAFTPESLALCEERRVELKARRGIVLEGLAAIGLPVPVEPDGAFYVYIDVSGTGLDAWRFCEEVLQHAHVSLTPGRDFAVATAETHVRLSYAASRADLSEGIARIGAFLDGRRGEAEHGDRPSTP